jgi:hypothetical protein
VSALSSLVAADLLDRIACYCETHTPAWIFGTDCGSRCFPGRPGKVRKPDVSPVLRDRSTAVVRSNDDKADTIAL